VLDVDEIEITQRPKQAPPVQKTFNQSEPKSDKVIEGEVKIWNEATGSYEVGY
jgi:hypothetical protein